MADNLGVDIKITADGKSAVGEVAAVANALGNIGQSAQTAAPSIDKVVDAAGALGKTAFGMNEIAEAFGRLGGMATDAAKLADEFTGLTARLKLAAGEGESFIHAFDQVRQIANTTGADLTATATLFGRLTMATKELGLSQGQVAQLTESVNKSFVVSGASAAETAGAVRQLAQALASGVLRGDEFNSVMENSPRLSKALADGLKVTTGELRAMAEEGKLTADGLSKYPV